MSWRHNHHVCLSESCLRYSWINLWKTVSFSTTSISWAPVSTPTNIWYKTFSTTSISWAPVSTPTNIWYKTFSHHQYKQSYNHYNLYIKVTKGLHYQVAKIRSSAVRFRFIKKYITKSTEKKVLSLINPVSIFQNWDLTTFLEEC